MLQHLTLPWKNKEHRDLPYINEPFNDPRSVTDWRYKGYAGLQHTGDMYDMQQRWPDFLDMSNYQTVLGWEQLSWSFYRMRTATIMPEHVDTYRKFHLLHPEAKVYTMMRAIVFLEDWSPGHVLTLGDQQVPQWKAGDLVQWEDATPHLAANVGIVDRYTLQLTGYK